MDDANDDRPQLCSRPDLGSCTAVVASLPGLVPKIPATFLVKAGQAALRRVLDTKSCSKGHDSNRASGHGKM
jgi:hypothetical protein